MGREKDRTAPGLCGIADALQIDHLDVLVAILAVDLCEVQHLDECLDHVAVDLFRDEPQLGGRLLFTEGGLQVCVGNEPPPLIKEEDDIPDPPAEP